MPVEQSLLAKMDAYWRATNYLSAGQIYLLDNPLLRTPLSSEHIKPRLMGHWGTTPGLNFIYVHLNRLINAYDLNVLYMTGPGHGGPALIANTYLEGSYSEFYPEITQDISGLKKLFKQFSFPGGVPSHTASETPGSIHEGGELGYVLAHAYGAVLDNPDLIVASVIGDGEAETGPLAASWHANKFLNPAKDGVVLPILLLNGYKIANPTLLDRISKQELMALFQGYGYEPYLLEGSDPKILHQQMAETLETVYDKIKQIKQKAQSQAMPTRPMWPMIILKIPKGWTGPKQWENAKIEGSFRAHQVPLKEVKTNPNQLAALAQWLMSYCPEKLFDEKGALLPELAALAPKGNRKMGKNPHANGGQLLKPLNLPPVKYHEFVIESPGTQYANTASVLGQYLKEVMQLNLEDRHFRVFGPDETASNRLDALFEVTQKMFMGRIEPGEDLSPDGRVMEILSEHVCQGWLEGYLLTGRHGFFSCYEAFIHIIDSMFNQHAKWLKASMALPWRRPIASLNYFLTSHVWRQDHNGYSHQDPGFLNHVVNKKSEIVRIYLPPDANSLLVCVKHCLNTKNKVNVIVAGKHPALQYRTLKQAKAHFSTGVAIWEFASNCGGSQPDVVMACCGDVPTLETLAAVSLLNKYLPEIKIRVVNVIDLMRLQDQEKDDYGLSHQAFRDFFTSDKPVIFAFHGYPALIHRLIYNRENHGHFHIHGYKEEGTTTTPFDMCVLNEIDRYHLAMDAINHLKKIEAKRSEILSDLTGKLIEHKAYIQEFGEDLPEVQDWRWGKKV